MKSLFLGLLALMLAACSEGPEKPQPDEVRELPESVTPATVEADDIPEPLGEPAAGGDPAQDVMADSSKPAGQIYNQYCVMCHASGAAGAPKLGDTDNWRARLEEKGYDNLVQNSLSGIGAMPARGGCMECSDEEIGKVVRFMLEETGIEL